MDEQEIVLRWLEVPAELALQTSLLPHGTQMAIAVKALGALGISLQEGEAPLHAWQRVMHEENGLEMQVPAHPAIRDAVEQTAGINTFLWALASIPGAIA